MSMLFSHGIIAYNAPEPRLPTFSVRPPMSEIDDRVLAPCVRTMQIIAFALITGVVVFLGIACFQVFIQRDGQPIRQGNELPMLSLMALAMLIGMGTASILVPFAMTRSALQRFGAAPRPKDQESEVITLLNIKQTSMIVSMALLQGAAFFGCIALMIEARPFTLSIVGTAIVSMVIGFPTLGRVRTWVSNQLTQLDRTRNRGQAPIIPR